jgi:hypothetical protein
METVTISARRLKALESAENCVRAFRATIATPVGGRFVEWQEAHDLAMDWLIYWLELGPRNKFDLPPDVPARWKYNRDQAMRGWPDKRKGGGD